MSIEEILRRRLRHYGLEKAYDASVVVEAAKKVAKGRFDPVSYKNKILKVTAPTPGQAHLLKLQEKSLIEEIEEASKARITRIIFTVKS